MTQPTAGWYPDSEVPGGERWWNGVQWSDQRRTSGAAAAPPAPPAPPQAAAPVPAVAPAADAPVLDADPSIPAPPVAPGFTPSAAVADGVPTSTLPPAYAAPATTPYGVRPAVAAQQNVLAIVGLVLSIGSLLIGLFGLVPVAGIIVSVMGYRKSAELGGRGRGLAIAGIIVGAVSLLLLLLLLVIDL